MSTTLLTLAAVLAIVLSGLAAVLRTWELFANGATMPALIGLALVLGLYSYLSIVRPERKSIGGLAVVLVLFLAISLAYVYRDVWPFLDLARLAWAIAPEAAAVLGGVAVGMVWQTHEAAQERKDALPLEKMRAQTALQEAVNEGKRLANEGKQLANEGKRLTATVTETHTRQVTAPVEAKPDNALPSPSVNGGKREAVKRIMAERGVSERQAYRLLDKGA